MNSKRKGYKVEATPSFRRMLEKLSREAQHKTLEKLKKLETTTESSTQLMITKEESFYTQSSTEEEPTNHSQPKLKFKTIELGQPYQT